jgi:hypothetical protein
VAVTAGAADGIATASSRSAASCMIVPAVARISTVPCWAGSIACCPVFARVNCAAGPAGAPMLTVCVLPIRPGVHSWLAPGVPT